MTDKQREKIKQKIRSLRSKLSAEKRKHGWYDDSYGNRYIIGGLYLKLGDYKLAKKYYDWFDKEFPDDIGFPEFNFGRIRTFYEFKNYKEGLSKLIDIETNNTYLIDVVLEKSIQHVDKWEWSNMATLEYAHKIKNDCQKHLTTEFKDWLERTTLSSKYQEYKQRIIESQIHLKTENSTEKRKELLDRTEELIEEWKTNA